jgi:hypothetical protein
MRMSKLQLDGVCCQFFSLRVTGAPEKNLLQLLPGVAVPFRGDRGSAHSGGRLPPTLPELCAFAKAVLGFRV